MRTLITTLITLLASSGSAFAAGHALSFQTGLQNTADERWELVSWNTGINSVGLRYDHDLSENLALVSSFHWASNGGEVELYDMEEDNYADAFHIALDTQQLGLGAKYDHSLRPWLEAYGTGQLLGMHGRLRLDDDIDSDDNATQLMDHAFTGGIYSALGVEWIPSKAHRKVRFTTHLEVGYGHLLPIAFDAAPGTSEKAESMEPVRIGDLRFNGLAMRWGVGARF